MVNQPCLARLFSAGSLTGFGDLMGGDGISMDELECAVQLQEQCHQREWRARRRAARSAPPPTAISTGRKAPLALKGSLVPAYGLNSRAQQYSAAGRPAGVEERRGHLRRHLFGDRQCRPARYQHQSAVDADAGHPAPHLRRPYAQRRERAVQRAGRRRPRRRPTPTAQRTRPSRTRLASPARASSCRWTASARRRC